jgi:Zn-finger nucleic acid-binding protein
MNCPVCTTTQLTVTDRLGIEIDVCPKCRGVWLDRGELEKIVERSVDEMLPAGTHEVRARRPDDEHGHYGHDDDRRDDDHHDHDRDDRAGRYRGHKRRSWLRDLFDF